MGNLTEPMASMLRELTGGWPTVLDYGHADLRFAHVYGYLPRQTMHALERRGFASRYKVEVAVWVPTEAGCHVRGIEQEGIPGPLARAAMASATKRWAKYIGNQESSHCPSCSDYTVFDPRVRAEERGEEKLRDAAPKLAEALRETLAWCGNCCGCGEVIDGVPCPICSPARSLLKEVGIAI